MQITKHLQISANKKAANLFQIIWASKYICALNRRCLIDSRLFLTVLFKLKARQTQRASWLKKWNLWYTDRSWKVYLSASLRRMRYCLLQNTLWGITMDDRFPNSCLTGSKSVHFCLESLSTVQKYSYWHLMTCSYTDLCTLMT